MVNFKTGQTVRYKPVGGMSNNKQARIITSGG